MKDYHWFPRRFPVIRTSKRQKKQQAHQPCIYSFPVIVLFHPFSSERTRIPYTRDARHSSPQESFYFRIVNSAVRSASDTLIGCAPVGWFTDLIFSFTCFSKVSVLNNTTPFTLAELWLPSPLIRRSCRLVKTKSFPSLP